EHRPTGRSGSRCVEQHRRSRRLTPPPGPARRGGHPDRDRPPAIRQRRPCGVSANALRKSRAGLRPGPPGSTAARRVEPTRTLVFGGLSGSPDHAIEGSSMDAPTGANIRTGTLSVGDIKATFPVHEGTIGPSVVDISKLYGTTGLFTYDPGF